MPITFSFFANTNPLNPNSPSSYVKVGFAPTCLGTTQVCSIYAQVDANNLPIITEDLDTEITTAVNTHVPSANVKLRAA